MNGKSITYGGLAFIFWFDAYFLLLYLCIVDAI